MACDPLRPPPTEKSERKKLRPTLPPSLKLGPRTVPGVSAIRPRESRRLRGRSSISLVVTTWPTEALEVSMPALVVVTTTVSLTLAGRSSMSNWKT
jgi:hypothetical protein